MSIVQSKTVRISHLEILKVKTKLSFFFFLQDEECSRKLNNILCKARDLKRVRTGRNSYKCAASSFSIENAENQKP